MTNLTNLLRDQLHVDMVQGAIQITGLYNPIGNTINANNAGNVYQTAGSMYCNYTTTNQGNVNYWQGAAVLMSQAIVDDTPFRVKGYVQAYLSETRLFVGYAPASPTGSGDNIINVRSWPLSSLKTEHGKIDEIIKMTGLPKAHPYYQRPIAFGIAISSSASGANCSYALSVQNLAKTAPQYAASMS